MSCLGKPDSVSAIAACKDLLCAKCHARQTVRFVSGEKQKLKMIRKGMKRAICIICIRRVQSAMCGIPAFGTRFTGSLFILESTAVQPAHAR